MNVIQSIEYMVFLKNVKEDIMSNYGKNLQIVSIAFQYQLLLKIKFFVCMEGSLPN